MLRGCRTLRMEAKRRAPDEIAARQCAADEKHRKDAEKQQAAPTLQLAAI